eukprot:SAG31_NODE_22212_length_531_cov_0.979167_1_plen_151_part_00
MLTCQSIAIAALIGGDPVYPDELSDFFEDTLLDQFACDAEDNSCREVAEVLVRQFQAAVIMGDFTQADQLIANAQRAANEALQRSVAGQETAEAATDAALGTEMMLRNAGSSDGGDNGMAAEPTQPAEPAGPIIDEDGFELVQRKGGRRR